MGKSKLTTPKWTQDPAGDLKVPFIKDVIQENHDKLGNHSNTTLQPLQEHQQRRRLKKLWPADLIDG
jgi:hypothetical protein